MTWMKDWLLAITCAAVASALAEALCPQGTAKKLVRMAGGLLLILAILGPAARLDELELPDLLADYRTQRSRYEEALAANEDVMKGIIAEEAGAYILDKATELGLRECAVTVTCRMDESGFPVPAAVTVRGTGGDEAWAELARAITADFAIGAENQTFERTEGP